MKVPTEIKIKIAELLNITDICKMRLIDRNWKEICNFCLQKNSLCEVPKSKSFTGPIFGQKLDSIVFLHEILGAPFSRKNLTTVLSRCFTHRINDEPCKNKQIIEYILETCCSGAEHCSFLEDLMAEATAYGCLETVKYLYSKIYVINGIDFPIDESDLDTAVSSAHFNIMRFFYEKTGRLSTRALHYAICNKNYAAVCFITEHSPHLTLEQIQNGMIEARLFNCRAIVKHLRNCKKNKMKIFS